ncbi:MFS transporter [Phascolarctobacterium sp.]|uniref:MFS transporter n=1 Tax=Phascolarctobacterium sp. TaxID=2049039 RepID=UPI00386591C5
MSNNTATQYQGNDKLLLGIVLGVITFWLFAQTTLNIAPTMSAELGIEATWMNIAVSITALFSGIFIVVMGGLGDRIGRVKVTLLGVILNAVGSLLIVLSPADTVTFLMAGRIIQGLSAACIMPSTLALLKAYYDGVARQRAVSFWSIGSWGGSGLCSLFGGYMASNFGWRYIFWISIAISIVSFLLIYGTPESKVEDDGKKKGFDWSGLITFMIALVSLNVVVGQGSKLGWTNPLIMGLAGVFAVAFAAFYKIENSKDNAFVNFKIFNNKTYSGATLSNFLLNGAAGTLLVSLSLVQHASGMSAFEAGMLTIGYLVAILATIRVGEKLLQRWGARKPMIIGCSITATGILLLSMSFLYEWQYIIAAVIGYTLFGIGLGFYATPSTDAALSNVPEDQVGAAAGIYKMASSLGAAFGVAISAALYTGLMHVSSVPMAWLFVGRADNVAIRYAAAIALLFNVFMTLVAIISIMITVPKHKAEK